MERSCVLEIINSHYIMLRDLSEILPLSGTGGVLDGNPKKV
jgi:hypothetical protein